MYNENDLIYSPLQRSYAAEGKEVEIHIYRMPNTQWTVEVVDQAGTSTVYDDTFGTDSKALEVVLADLEAEGIDAFIGPDLA